MSRRVYTGQGATKYRVAQPGETQSVASGGVVERYDPWWAPSEQLDEFGIGISIYFRTLKAFAVIYLITGGINIMAMMANERDCNPENEELGLMRGTVWQGGKPGQEYTLTDDQAVGLAECLTLDGQVLADILVVIAFIIFIILINQFEDNIILQIDLDQQTTQDYSVWVRNPPADFCDPKDYYEFFSKFGEVCFITVAKNNGDLIDALSERKALMERIADLRDAGFTIENQNANRTWLRWLMMQMGSVTCMAAMEERIKVLNVDIEALAQKEYVPWRVFVIFNREEDQQYCLSKLNFFQGTELGVDKNITFKNMNLYVEEAPEPSSVKYTSSHFTTNYKHLTWVVSFLFSGGLIVCGFLVIQNMVKTAPETVALFVSLLNSVLPTIMKMSTTMFEVHDTQDSEQSSILIKLLVSRCLTATVIIYIATPFNERFNNDKLDASIQVLLFDCFFGPVMRFLDPYNSLVRYVIAPRVSQTQDELNAFFEATQWTLAERYTDVMKTAVVGLFYAVPIPQGLFITAAAMIINYFTDKYFLFRVWARPPMLDGKLAMTARYFFGATLWTHVCISMHFFANWPYVSEKADAKCGMFLCEDYDYMLEDQKEAVETYSAFNIAIFVILCMWFLQEYIWLLLITLEVVSQDDKSSAEDTVPDIDFRQVQGEFAYVPFVDRIELADDCLCVDVTGIPWGRFPAPHETVDDIQEAPKKDAKGKAAKRGSRVLKGAGDRGEILSVVNSDEFHFLEKGSATSAAVLKNIFSEIRYFEPTGFNTRVENFNTAKGFGNLMGGVASGLTGGLFNKAKPSMQHAAGNANTPPAPPATSGGHGAGPLAKAAARATNAKAAAGMVPPPPALPAGWEAKQTPEGKPYYVNHRTKVTQWHAPTE